MVVLLAAVSLGREARSIAPLARSLRFDLDGRASNAKSKPGVSHENSGCCCAEDVHAHDDDVVDDDAEEDAEDAEGALATTDGGRDRDIARYDVP